MFVCYAIKFPISADVSFDFEMKRKKKKGCLLQKEKKTKRKKRVETPLPGTEHGGS